MNITIIGIGRLGLGLGLLIEKNGNNVLGIDINEKYVEELNNKTFKTNEPEYENLLLSSINFNASTDLQKGLDHADLIFIVVQTPNGGNKNFYDHTILSNLLSKINRLKPENKHFIIGCTVMPKYINTIGNLLIEDCKNCSLSYNPEFIAQGEIIKGFLHPDIILVGTTNDYVKEKMKEIYDKMTLSNPKYCIMKPLESEIVKIGINGYITTKLSFCNMISDLCDNVNADKNIVLDSIGSDKRIGNKYFKPGYSFGGPCFPRDTKALKLLADQNDINSDLLSATTKYNEIHIDYMVEKLLKENKDTYIFENICYKEDSKIPIIEESAKLKIAEKLYKKGKKIIIKDEIQLINEVKKEYGNIFEYIIV